MKHCYGCGNHWVIGSNSCPQCYSDDVAECKNETDCNPFLERKIQFSKLAIEKCVVCGGLIHTSCVYPDNKSYHGDCYDVIREVVEKEVHGKWLKEFNDKILEEKEARESEI